MEYIYENHLGDTDIVHKNEETAIIAQINRKSDGSIVATIYSDGNIEEHKFPADTSLTYVKKWCKEQLYPKKTLTGITDSQSEKNYYNISFTADVSDYQIKINTFPVVFSPPYGYRIISND